MVACYRSQNLLFEQVFQSAGKDILD